MRVLVINILIQDPVILGTETHIARVLVYGTKKVLELLTPWIYFVVDA
jgi:hypothetical protein